MKKVFYILLLIVCLLFFIGRETLYSQDAKAQYRQAIQFLKEKKYDFAFMAFRAIIRDFPESEYAQKSMFAVGEYFYSQRAYYEALESFAKYIRNYPDSDGAIFAKAHLLKIMQGIERPTEKMKEIIDNIKMNFFSKSLFLLFCEYKEVSYKSAFQNEFTIRYYIDMIEVRRNGKVFIKITQ